MMSKKWDTIFLDWDGVIWDFKQAYCDWFAVGVPDTDKWEFYEALGHDADEFHEILSELPQEFWQQEKYIMPHAQDLVAWARRNADMVFILTVAPEFSTAQGKQNLARKLFDLGIYTVDKAEDKAKFAEESCLLIDDKPSSVVSFTNANPVSGGFVWPANYNNGLDESWYFKRSWLHEHKAHWALTDTDRADMLKDEKRVSIPVGDWVKAGASIGKARENVAAAAKVAKAEKQYRLGGTIHDVNLYDYSGKLENKLEKPKLDYEAMDEAKRRKMTPMYSGLLAYFPDALALVARNSMIGHYQHNDPKDPMYWDRSKSADEMDAMIRHMADHSRDPYDSDGTLHMSKVAWRALAFLQKFIEEIGGLDDSV